MTWPQAKGHPGSPQGLGQGARPCLLLDLGLLASTLGEEISVALRHPVVGLRVASVNLLSFCLIEFHGSEEVGGAEAGLFAP